MFIVMVMALALGLLAGNAMAQIGVLQGTVTDVDTGLPIDHALVVARGEMGGHGGGDGHGGGGHGGGGHHPPRYAYTDLDGFYEIADLPDGTYDVTCGKPGYVRSAAQVVIEDGQTLTQDFALEPLVYGSVGGTVIDAISGLPLEGAHVMLHPAQSPGLKGGGPGHGGGGGMWLHAVTDADGNYLIENVPLGTYDARAMMFGYVPSEPLTVVVTEGVTTDADFALAPLTFGSLEGTVTDADTTLPIEGAFVVACRFGFDGPLPGEAMAKGMSMEKGGGGGWNFAITDENGFYDFDQLPAGTWTVRAFKWGYDVGTAEVIIAENTTTVQDFALTPR
jgi:protocatechuate 3,4-dioxygenase beta subunit